MYKDRSALTDFIDISALERDEILGLIRQADDYARALDEGQASDQSKKPAQYDFADQLKGKVILQFFAESSTRTKTSFEMAAYRLGAQVINWDPSTSSLSKDESFLDTIQTLAAMQPDALVIRHKDYNAPHFVAQYMPCPVINAGDSWRAHPSQALLDALTIYQETCPMDVRVTGMTGKFNPFDGLKIAIIGDIAHSRVVSSNLVLWDKLGVKVHLIAPSILMPEKLPGGVDQSSPNVVLFDNLAEGLADCDFAMALRLQKERMEKTLIADEKAYFNEFGLSYESLKFAKPGAKILHPGPMNRGIEIADDLPDDPEKSLILRQVRNGVAARMAIFTHCLAG